MKNKITHILAALKKVNYIALAKEGLFLTKFFILVIVFILEKFLKVNWKISQKIPGLKQVVRPLKNPVITAYHKIAELLNSADPGEISSLDIIRLASKHLSAKKNRTIITIGGMAVGFGSVIFLLSLGYGAQRLVISRVARLNEMQQIDVTVGQASSLRINEASVSELAAMEDVQAVLPLVSVVSKVEYNSSVSDAVAYGVSSQYLEESAIKPSKGKIFEDGEVVAYNWKAVGEVAGDEDVKIVNAKFGKEVAQVQYSIFPLIWKPVYSQPSTESEIIGYTQRGAGTQTTSEVWGEPYHPSFETLSGIDYFGNEYEPWIQDDFLLWKKESCNDSDYNCVDGEYVRLVEGGVQFVRSGYVTEQDVTLERFHIEYSVGPSLEEGEVISEVQFGFPSAEYVPIYSSPEEGKADLQLTTSRDIETDYFQGTLVFGGAYASQDSWGRAAKNEHGTEMGLWIRAKVPLWRKVDCGDCEKMYLRELDTYENQVEAFAFIKASEVAIEELEQPPVFGSVLGEATASAEVSETNVLETTVAAGADIEETPGEIVLDDGTIISLSEAEDGQIEWVSIASNSAGVTSDKSDLPKISFPEGTQKVVLVNRALLSVLGLSEAEAVGKTFRASLVLDSEFYEDGESRSETEYTDLTIIGVIPEEKTPAFYMPFTDMKSLGIQNYSQLKVVTKNQGVLKDVRKAIEGLGFRTASVVDTVSRINSLFDTIRILLTTLGLIALSIAALGMFNTLTVSLLEKTREVGLMKTIGMKSNEVKRLFLAESIIMGLSGGFFGLFLGAFAGYALSFFLSTIAVANGLGTINLVYIPFSLVLGILGLSFIVGIATGLYPSKRATTISALNALRYE